MKTKQLTKTIHTDALNALNCLTETLHLLPKDTTRYGLSMTTVATYFHYIIFMTFIQDTHHDIYGKYLQKHLDEYTYRLNRRLWKTEIPNQPPLRLAVNHRPVKFQAVHCS